MNEIMKELLSILSTMDDEELTKFLYYAKGLIDGSKRESSASK